MASARRSSSASSARGATPTCAVPGHAMKRGGSGRRRAEAATPPQPAPAPALPAATTSRRPATSRLVVVEQRGLVHLLVDGQRRDRSSTCGRGCSPRARPGSLDRVRAGLRDEQARVRVLQRSRRQLRLVELRRSAVDPDTVDPEPARELLYQAKLAPNHNGGMLQFAEDGRLYVAVGDGGPVPPSSPERLRADGTSIFGKIIRLDPATGSWEVWARGLRNPWKFWHDATSGRTFVADVGQERREEINVIPEHATINFGWPCFEGTLSFDPDEERCASRTGPRIPPRCRRMLDHGRRRRPRSQASRPRRGVRLRRPLLGESPCADGRRRSCDHLTVGC